MRPLYIPGLIMTRLVLTPHPHNYVIVDGERYELSAFLEEEHEDNDS